MDKDKMPKPIPMRERWKHDIPRPVVVGHKESTEEEKKQAQKDMEEWMEKERKLFKEYEERKKRERENGSKS